MVFPGRSLRLWRWINFLRRDIALRDRLGSALAKLWDDPAVKDGGVASSRPRLSLGGRVLAHEQFHQCRDRHGGARLGALGGRIPPGSHGSQNSRARIRACSGVSGP